MCRVDMIQREVPERAEERDDLQDQCYADDLDQESREQWRLSHSETCRVRRRRNDDPAVVLST